MPPEPTTASTGATPDAGATPAQPAPAGDPAGATPAAVTTKSTPADPPATGDEALGEAGKAILRDARRAAKEADDRAKAAENELTQLREAGQSDQEKALTQREREARADERAKFQRVARDIRVAGALQGAGVMEKYLPLALVAPALASLKVDVDTGTVEGLTEAVAAFKTENAEMFGARAEPGPGGSWGGSEGGSNRKEPASMEEAIAARLAQQTKH